MNRPLCHYTTLAVSTRETLPRGKFSNLHRLIYPICVERTFDFGVNGRRVKFASLPRLSLPRVKSRCIYIVDLPDLH